MILIELVFNMIWLMVKRTQSDYVLRDKPFEIASNPKNDGYQKGLASMVYKFFDKKSKGSGIKSMLNEHLANELNKPIIRNFFKKEGFILHLKTIFGVLI